MASRSFGSLRSIFVTPGVKRESSKPSSSNFTRQIQFKCLHVPEMYHGVSVLAYFKRIIGHGRRFCEVREAQAVTRIRLVPHEMEEEKKPWYKYEQS